MAQRMSPIKLVAAVLVCTLLAISSWAVFANDTEQNAPPAIDERAVDVLNQMSRHLASLDAYSTNVELVMTIERPDGKQTDEDSFQLAIAKPNRLVARSADERFGETAVSNGEKLFLHLAMFDAYVETDAPSDLISLLKEMQELSIATGAFSVGTLAPMLAPDGPDGQLGTLRNATYHGEAELNGTPTHHVSLSVAPELSDENKQRMREEMGENAVMIYHMDAWIGVDQPRLHKVQFDLSRMLADLMPDMMEFMPEMKDMKYQMTMTLTEWKTGDDVNRELFAFKVPEGADKHESVDELMAALSAPAEPPSQLLGKPAPDFDAELLDGESISLAQHKGRDIVILDFWATWCGPCIQAMPGLMEVAEAYKDRNVVFYAVNVQETPSNVKTFLQEKDWDLTIPMDRDGKISTKFMVSGIPQTVVIDKDGTVQAVHIGFSPNMKTTLQNELDTLLRGEKLASAPESDDQEDPDQSKE